MQNTMALGMTDSNCGERMKLSFVDLDSRINEYHTSLVQAQRAVCHQKQLTKHQSHTKKVFALPL